MGSGRQRRTWYKEQLRRQRMKVIKRWAAIGSLAVALIAFALLAAKPWEAPAPMVDVAPNPAFTIPQAPETTSIAVIGDSYTGGSKEGGMEDVNWVPLAQYALSSKDRPVRIRAESAGGSGYVNVGPTGKVFSDLVAEAIRPGTDLIVFFGSRNDMEEATLVGRAATSAFDEATAVSPSGELLVIGAPWVDSDVPQSITVVNTALKQATDGAGGTFIDPVAEGWFFENPELIGSDGVHPTDAGHEYLAKQIVPHIEKVLAD